MPATSSPEAPQGLRRELVVLKGAARSGVAAAVVLLLGVLLGAGPAAAYWAAYGKGSATAAVATLLPPTNLVVTAGSGSTVAVSWTGSAGAVVPAGYYVTRTSGSTTTAACGSSASSLVTGTSCSDASVPDGTFQYRVTAVYRSWTAASGASGAVTVSTLAKLAFTAQPSASVTAGSAISTLTVQLQTAGGVPLLTGGVQVAIGIGTNPGGGTLSGTLTATTNPNGVATFSGLSIDKAGAGYTLAASSTGYSGAVSTGFSVSPAAATKLVVTAGSSLAGTASSAALLGPVTLQRQDAYGNPVTAGTTAISLASSSATGSFSASANGAKATSVSIAAGAVSASFFFGDTKAGTATITAAATGLSSPAPVTASITAAAPGKLKFDAVPASVPKNVSITPPVTVHILDAFGNATDSTAAVAIQSTCTLKTTSTLTVPAVSGTASFPDLQIAGKATGCTLTATSGTLAADTSNAFNVE
ncbi:hypothetical protein [Arthrobacter sp. MAHUQ-56]